MNPTYTFPEIIEQLRWAETPGHVKLIVELVIEEKHSYCLFHLRLITEAARQKRLFFQRVKL
jgi:hypothetical protein